MNNDFLVEVFGRTHGFAYQYAGESTNTVDITVEFCTAANNHLLDTTVTQLHSGEWVIWSSIAIENDPNFNLLFELQEPVIPEPVEEFIPDGSTLPPDNQGQ